MRNDFESNYLAHHGILGQKWGVKNGPPYPLGASDHNASERKAGYKKSIGGGRNKELYNRKATTQSNSKSSNSDKKEKFHLTDKQKKMIAIGAAVAGTALIAYGAYKLGASDKLGDLGLKGAAAVDRILKRNKGAGDFLNDINDLSIATGIDLNSKVLSIKEATAKVNPGYSSGSLGRTRNCFSAVTADLANRANNGKGLNAFAREATEAEIKAGGIPFNKLLKPYEGSSIDDIIIPRTSLNEAKQNLAKQIIDKTGGSDGFGVIRIKKAGSDTSIGHYMKWEISNGECIFSDSLSGTTEKADRYLNAIASGQISRSIEFSRVDGLAVNPFELRELLAKS